MKKNNSSNDVYKSIRIAAHKFFLCEIRNYCNLKLHQLLHKRKIVVTLFYFCKNYFDETLFLHFGSGFYFIWFNTM